MKPPRWESSFLAGMVFQRDGSARSSGSRAPSGSHLPAISQWAPTEICMLLDASELC